MLGAGTARHPPRFVPFWPSRPGTPVLMPQFPRGRLPATSFAPLTREPERLSGWHFPTRPSSLSAMALPADYHMHTPLCRHAVGGPIQYAARALQVGLTEIGFSDHSPMQQDGFDDWRMDLAQLDEYVASVRAAQKAHPSLTIKLALEVDYIPGHEDWIRDLATRHPWDYFIGSVHYVSESWDLDNPKKLSQWRERDPFEVWTAYFERLTMARCLRAIRNHRPRRPGQEVLLFIQSRIAPTSIAPSSTRRENPAPPLSSTRPACARDAKRFIPAPPCSSRF